MNVYFKKINENAIVPKRASELAGGWDITATEIDKVGDDLVICKIGLCFSLPEAHKLTLVPRSSLTKTNWVLQNSPALGDEDYRGEYQLRFRCIPNGIRLNEYNQPILTYEDFPFNVGDRIGQIYLETVIPIEFKESDKLSETERGNGGFGHSGK